jgi:hypothetical protein
LVNLVNKQELRSEKAALPTEQQIFVAGEGLSIAFGASGAIGFGAEWDTEENFYRRAVITPY